MNQEALQPYLQLYGAKSSRHLGGPCFICEGHFLVKAALQAAASGELRVISVLGTAAALDQVSPLLPQGTLLLEYPKEKLQEIVGFPFHRGLLCAVQQPQEKSLERLWAAKRLVVLPHVDNVENLGLILRSAAALGMDGVVAGAGPGIWDRRTIRVSMGAAWRIPVWQREDVPALLNTWRRQDGEVVGATLKPKAIEAQTWQPKERTALVLGPEAQGLSEEWIQRCDVQVAIRMANGMDSLNVAAAGAILMFKMAGSVFKVHGAATEARQDA